jgi:hypothetical protein
MTTTSRESDWGAERKTLTRCPKCKGLRLLASLEPHAPHYVAKGSSITLVDCVGQEVAR